LVITAPRDDNNVVDSGSAYVFTREGGSWTEQAKLVASDGEYGDKFGTSVAVYGDTAVIGAPYDDDKGSNSGSAYVFNRDNMGSWYQESKLVPADGAASAWFGTTVAMDGDTVVITASGDDDLGVVSGSAYVFTRDSGSWVEQTKLLASDGAERDQFGVSAAIDGDTVVIGSYFDDDLYTSAGSAYVFTRDSNGFWTQQAKLLASDAAEWDRFGVDVAVDGDNALVGSGYDYDTTLNFHLGAGWVYVFTRSGDTWTEQAKLVASDTVAGDAFGGAQPGNPLAIQGDIALIGAGGDDANGVDSGSAYVFTLQDTDGDGILDLADPCPDDATNGCDPAASGVIVVQPQSGGTLVTPDGSLTLYIPPGAVDGPTVISVTETTASTGSGALFELDTNLGPALGLHGVEVNPEGLQFNTPITLIFSWSDGDNDGVVDGMEIPESDLRVFKDGVAITGRCGEPPTEELPTCDSSGNWFKVEVNSLSEFVLGVVSGTSTTLCDVLGEPRLPDLDAFLFQGTQGESLQVTLAPDPAGSASGDRALLTLLGLGLLKIDASALPNLVGATLPRTGTYWVTVTELLGRGRFTGAYCLTLESSGSAWQSLQKR
jgi:hypothetical protein